MAIIMVGLLILAHYLAPSPGWRIFLEAGVVIGGYGLMTLWLETHNSVLLDRSSAEIENQVAKALEEEMSLPLSSHVACQFYAGSDPAIIYGGPDHPNGNLRLNGHPHLAKTAPSTPEEAVE